MTHIRKIAFIGNSLPRRCGIATFTTDLQQAVSACASSIETAIVAMTDHGHAYQYPKIVHIQIADQKIDDYVAAANTLNAGEFDVVCLQHEFGIFGGVDGSHILALLSRLDMPVVTTLHTVLAEPTASQRRVLNTIIDISSKVVVMAEHGRKLLRHIYEVPASKIEVIAHGIPDIAFCEPEASKAKLGFQGKSVILTFGLLSPNKGIEVMIDAMPLILQSRQDAVYVVLGATHPNLVRNEGEAYRHRLATRARDLGVENHVVFLDQFVDLPTLLDFISMCDVYATPYLNEAQMTSGTLAYSFGSGKAVVSTPYWHARELLADGFGVLVPFNDAKAIGSEIAALLTDDVRRDAIGARAYKVSRSMTWERTAEHYLELFEQAVHPRTGPGEMAPVERKPSALAAHTYPEPNFDAFIAMCDDTGLFQHAVHSVPDRSHGYCVDDNARGLLLAVTLDACRDMPLPGILTTRFAAFVQHAWNPDARRFRNFMSFDRRWLEDMGSEDSHGRTLWALGECARSAPEASVSNWAGALFAEALPTVETFSSPRAWAFTLLGLDGYCAHRVDDINARRVRLRLAGKLMALLAKVEKPGRPWFEDGLSYDNARLPQALLLAGLAAGRADYVSAGLRTLRWLISIQTAREGHFRPVGSDGFSDIGMPPQRFDQQPLEAAATISACLVASRADRHPEWKDHAELALAWFLGKNDLSLPLVDTETGSCRDGLHRARANENRGAESLLSYLLGLVEFRELTRASSQAATASPAHALSA
ncbi:glycosyltransferase involved in cell wall biosynthesis [Neorhizobium huautlense]|uniref:Glycosyltransferase involved in cell wall biosynthesis n=1 Tax=Neorhizobium huautlense TaxID=67774 RepID=A0ABT9PW77_9HYPH|nr:glycosyltransferase family 4 protein [Neorhizobium huautlense]MDP9838695.1 glycosyltransferase involved in cell wall biosynthesis [Neorhizobium huautlense]